MGRGRVWGVGGGRGLWVRGWGCGGVVGGVGWCWGVVAVECGAGGVVGGGGCCIIVSLRPSVRPASDVRSLVPTVLARSISYLHVLSIT